MATGGIVTIPHTTKYTNINKPPFVNISNPVPIDDLWNPLAAASFDGVDDGKTTNTTPIGASSGVQHTIAWWAAMNTPTGSGWFLAQRTGSTIGRVYNIFPASDGSLVCHWFSSSSGNDVRSIIPSGELNWDDGNLHYFTNTINGNDNRIYIDSVPASNYTQLNDINGSGYTATTNAPKTLGVGVRSDGAFPAPDPFVLTRPTWWQGTTLTAPQVIDEHLAELAAEGEGFGNDNNRDYYYLLT